MKKKNIRYLSGFLVLISGFILITSCHPEFDPQLVTYPDITVEDFTPKAGRPTTEVTIKGTNFGEYPEAAKITFNGVEADEIISYSDTEIVVAVPHNAGSGSVNVQVWTHLKAVGDFEYIPGATLSSVTPDRGFSGEVVTLAGTNFGEDPGIITVMFGDVIAEIVSVTDTAIEVLVPETSSGVIRILVDTQLIEGPLFLIGEVLLTGNIFGHESSWNDNPATYVAAAFDGDTETFVDAPSAEGFAGIDLGEDIKAHVTMVRYFPRTTHASRMNGGEIRVSNDPDYLNTYTTLYTIPGTPLTTQYTEVTLDSEGESYRYIYYYHHNGYCNVAELEFYGVLEE